MDKQQQSPLHKFDELTGEASYHQKWTDYRRRIRIVVGMLVALPVILMLGLLAETQLVEDQMVLGLFILYGVCFIGVANYATFWRCPRCGKPFHIAYGRVANPMGRKCVHCGLPKWSPGPGGQSENKN